MFFSGEEEQAKIIQYVGLETDTSETWYTAKVACPVVLLSKVKFLFRVEVRCFRIVEDVLER